MTYTNLAIKKALEGGWKPEYTFDEGAKPRFGNFVLQHRYRFASTEFIYSDVLLDPLFWQALGKEMGWTGSIDREYSWKESRTNFPTDWNGEPLEMWLFHQHRFIDWLA